MSSGFQYALFVTQLHLNNFFYNFKQGILYFEIEIKEKYTTQKTNKNSFEIPWPRGTYRIRIRWAYIVKKYSMDL